MKADPSVKTPRQYIAKVPANRREAVQALHEAITKAAPKLKAHIVYGMIGYGPIHYKTRSGCEGDWALVCLANQKNYMSLYLGCEGDESGYIVEQNADKFGKVSCGKSCVRFKKLEDLDLKFTLQLIKRIARTYKPA